jgi:hypothetical protein
LGQLPRRFIDAYVVLQYPLECHTEILRATSKLKGVQGSSKCLFANEEDAFTLAIKLFTLALFIGSCLRLLLALVMYIPLLFRIRGNLKEYCAHKIDKR